MGKVTKIILGFLPMLTVCCVIFWFSSYIADDSMQQSSYVVDIIKSKAFPELNEMQTQKDQETVDDALSLIVRKIAHFSVCTLLGICAFAAFWMIRKKALRFAAAWGFAIAFAVSDEIHQYFVPGRSCELRDVLIDSCGAALGAGICLVAVLLMELAKLKKEKTAKPVN